MIVDILLFRLDGLDFIANIYVNTLYGTSSNTPQRLLGKTLKTREVADR